MSYIAASAFIAAATADAPDRHHVQVQDDGSVWLWDEDSNVAINITAGLAAVSALTATPNDKTPPA